MSRSNRGDRRFAPPVSPRRVYAAGFPGRQLARACQGVVIEPLDARRLLSGSNAVSGSYPAPATASAGDHFGQTLATRGALALVGAPGKVNPDTGIKVGGVALIDTATGATLQTFYDPNPTLEDGASLGNFGGAVSFVGATGIAIAAPSDGAGQAGRVYLYSDAADTAPEATIDNPYATGGQFGLGLASHGGNVLVGVPFTDNSGAAGAVLEYAPDGSLLRTIDSPSLQTFDQFGAHLAVTGDTLYASAQVGDGAGGVEGLVHKINLTTGATAATLHQPGYVPGSFASFGIDLATDGAAVYVGSAGPGEAYAFGTVSNTLVRTFADPDFNPAAGTSGFGSELSVGGGTLLVGNAASQRVIAGSEFTRGGGTVYLFDAATGEYFGAVDDPATTPYDGGDQPDNFGATSAALPGGTFLVGGFGIDDLGTDAGGAFVVSPGTATPPDNAPPVANAGPDLAPDEGSTFALHGTATDPDGQADVVGYEWDFDYSASAGFQPDVVGADQTYSYADDGPHAVALRVTDSQGHTSIDTLAVNVKNVAPLTTGAGPGAGVVAQPLTFTAGFTDPGTLDTHTVAWNFGDGSTIAAHPTTDAGALAATHAFALPGTYHVAVTVTDDDGGTSTHVTDVVVSASGVVNGNLYVNGTPGGDTVTLANAAGGGVTVTVGGVATTYLPAPGGQVYVYAGNGNDVVVAVPGFGRTLVVDGGAGDDVLTGGAGSNVLLGGPGTDILLGGAARDVLIGGAGSDGLAGLGGDDVLVAGPTSLDANTPALLSVLAEWNSTRAYAQRVANITGAANASSNRLNGTNFLRADATVFDDGAFDLLTGGAGSDYFIANTAGAGVRDLILDRTGIEIATDL